MARPEIARNWQALIREIAEANPGWGAQRIYNRLEQIAEEQGIADETPSQASVGRILRRHRRASERERALYREFHYPRSLVDNPELPWEASDFAGQVLRYYLFRRRRRPSVGRVIWHWRLSRARPQSSVEEQEEIVDTLVAEDAVGLGALPLTPAQRLAEQWALRPEENEIPELLDHNPLEEGD